MEAVPGIAQALECGIVTDHPIRIYTGILGQIGDIIMFTATARRLKELFPRSEVTFAVSERYREAGELVAGLPSIDRLFVTRLYFEKLVDRVFTPWNLGWPVELRGDDELAEQARHDLVLETRPRHRHERWWEHHHQVAELAHSVGVPGPIDLTTEIRIPEGTRLPPGAAGKLVIHPPAARVPDPAVDRTKSWPWRYLEELVRTIGPGQFVLLGGTGPPLPGVLDLRGRTTLAEAAAIIVASRCYVGIDSGSGTRAAGGWIAASLQAPVIGLYGTSYIPAYDAIHPKNSHAVYLQAEGTLDRIPVAAVLEQYEAMASPAPGERLAQWLP